MHAVETRDGIPASRAGGRELPGLVLDIDATLVTCHSEKENAAPTYKHGFVYRPLLCFLDNTGEALAGVLRPGHLRPTPPPTTSAGSPGHPPHARVPLAPPTQAGRLPALWRPGRRADRSGRPAMPAGTRIIVRRERPHPGAQLFLFDLDEGVRHQVFLTDTLYGQGPLQLLEVRHRAHARVEDRILCGMSTGFGRFPARHFQINATWLELSLAAIDLLASTQTLLANGKLDTAERK
ncbi:transposase [Streptomyces chiangmaiensis]|uniref:transposase n=1 Tax=Streptomyces chiangmaiensis TaxID=766497 RepID=UPI00337FAD16